MLVGESFDICFGNLLASVFQVLRISGLCLPAAGYKALGLFVIFPFMKALALLGVMKDFACAFCVLDVSLNGFMVHVEDAFPPPGRPDFRDLF